MDSHKQLLDAILDASLDGVLALSEAVEKPYASASYSALFPGWEELRYNQPLETVHNFFSKYIINTDAFLDLIAQVRRTRGQHTGRVYLFDGRIMQATGRVIRTEDGETEVWTHRDISEQCRKDENLQLRLHLITAVLNASPDAIFALVEGLEKPLTNAQYTAFFPDWEKYLRFGQPLKEIEDFFARYLVDWEAHVDLVDKVRRTQHYHQAVNHHKNGRIIAVSGKMVNFEFVQRGALEIYTLRDITEEVRSRQKMQAMQLTVDNLSEPVVWCDLQGRITYINQAACAAFGYGGLAEMAGKTFWDFYGTRPYGDEVSDAWSSMLARLRKDLHIKFDHVRLAKKDGAMLPCTVLIDYIAQGSEPFLAMCFHDLSEQIQRIEAERAAEAKSGFLARMSHEIRTPMNAIIGMSELAQREYGKAKAMEYIAGIKIAGVNLLAIINDLLDFSKIESGNFTLDPAPYETGSMLNDVLSIIRVRLMEKPVELIIDIDPSLPSALVGDVTRVKQVLLNILSNAVKYTEKGFIKLSVSWREASGGAAMLSVSVADSGIGIRSEDLPRLFNEFVRIEDKRAKSVVGTGLGLIITRSLCRAMGGDVTAESEYGQGAVFTATLLQGIAGRLPMGGLEDKMVERMERQCVPFTAPDTDILLVDDLPSNLLVGEGLLAAYGARIRTCLSGEEAVELVRSRSFDLVFMDHMMPGMDGMEATAAIRAMEGREALPIIALTANAVSGMKEMFLHNGFSDFLSKPIELSKLAGIMEKWIPVNRRGQARDDAAPAVAAQPLFLPEIEGVDMFAGLAHVDGAQSRYINLLEIFCRDARDRLPLLEKAPGEEERNYFTTQIHALKSALAVIGASDLSSSAARLEKAGRAGDMPTVHNCLGAFHDALKALLERIEAALARPQGEEGGGRQAGRERELLRQLKDALEKEDFEAMDNTLESLKAMPLAPDIRAALAEFAEYILSADFKVAADIIKRFYYWMFRKTFPRR